MSTAQLIAELMTKYDESRARWIMTNKTAEGFDAWFTKQVMG